MFRHQLPAYSPLTVGGIVRALLDAGPEARMRLKGRLRERFDAKRVVLCGSGTQALTLAIRSAAPEGRVPLVALPAYACYDLVSAAVGADARIVFYDLVPETLSPDPGSLAEACAVGPDAVVVAPLYGIPVDWGMVERVARPSGALLVEDAAQGLGATWGTRPLGSLGDVSVLSFGRGKGWTGGAGGALLERAARIPAAQPALHRVPALSLAGRVLAQWALGRPTVYGIPSAIPWLALGETVYRPPVEPAGIHGFAAALALQNELASTDAGTGRRRKAAAFAERIRTLQASGDINVICPTSQGEAGFLRLPLLARRGMAGFADSRQAMARGIMPGYPGLLPNLPEAARRIARPNGVPRESLFPGAARIAATLITVPTHALVSADDQDRIVEILARYRS